MPVKRRKLLAVIPISTSSVPDQILSNRKSPFASVADAAVYLKESKRTVRELVGRGVFKLVPNSNGKEKPWRLLWSEIENHAAFQIQKAA
jgi:hypothetical protein